MSITSNANRRDILPSSMVSRSVLLLLVVVVVHTVELCSAQQLIHQVRPDLPSCEDFDIVAGESLLENCETHCFPEPFESFDYAQLSGDGTSMVRNTVCRCFDDGTGDGSGGTSTDTANVTGVVSVDSNGRKKTFECWTEAEVWDMSTPVFACGEVYNITSLDTCKTMCQRMDPTAISFSGSGRGGVRCACAEEVPICDDSSDAWSSSWGRKNKLVLPTLAVLLCSFVTAALI